MILPSKKMTSQNFSVEFRMVPYNKHLFLCFSTTVKLVYDGLLLLGQPLFGTHILFFWVGSTKGRGD